MSEEGGDELERKAVDVLREHKDGMLQSELWKSLGISSREGSRLVLRLMRRGLVRREEVTVNGKRTYRVYLVETRAARFSPRIDVSSILDIPCVKCPHLNECGLGGFYDPSNCDLFESWLKREVARLRSQRRQEGVVQAAKG